MKINRQHEHLSIEEMLEYIKSHLDDIRKLDKENVKYTDELNISVTLAEAYLEDVARILKELNELLYNKER
jgi:uncharacterized protein YqgV (UPF0045/DUF77 family)